jgi:hypothetical protein
MLRPAALGHKQPLNYRQILACERLLSGKADTRHSEYWGMRAAAFGQKQTCYVAHSYEMPHKGCLNLPSGTNMQTLCVPVVLVLIALISGCVTTMEPVPDTNAAPLRLSIAVGDKVRVLTKYGDRPTFKVLDITETALIGKDQSIRYDDMAFVEKKSRKAASENALAVSLVLALGAVAVDGFGRIAPGFPSAQ